MKNTFPNRHKFIALFRAMSDSERKQVTSDMDQIDKVQHVTRSNAFAFAALAIERPDVASHLFAMYLPEESTHDQKSR